MQRLNASYEYYPLSRNDIEWSSVLGSHDATRLGKQNRAHVGSAFSRQARNDLTLSAKGVFPQRRGVRHTAHANTQIYLISKHTFPGSEPQFFTEGMCPVYWHLKTDCFPEQRLPIEGWDPFS